MARSSCQPGSWRIDGNLRSPVQTFRGISDGMIRLMRALTSGPILFAKIGPPGPRRPHQLFVRSATLTCWDWLVSTVSAKK